MKTNFIGAVILCAVISLTLGSEYIIKDDNNKTCLEVKMDVEFTLTNGNETIKFDGTNFTVKGGECAKPADSVASLTLSTDNEDFLSLTFKIDAQEQSTMDTMFTFAPFEYFPGTPTPNMISMLDNGDLILGGKTQLFNCSSLQRIILNGKLDNITYTMYMDLYNTQIQAFDIMDGNLSSNG